MAQEGERHLALIHFLLEILNDFESWMSRPGRREGEGTGYDKTAGVGMIRSALLSLVTFLVITSTPGSSPAMLEGGEEAVIFYSPG